jgi:hypothetical protein
MDQRERLAGLEAEKEHETPASLLRRRKIHPFPATDHVLPHDGGIVAQRRNPEARNRAGNDIGHVAGLVQIRRNLIARARPIDRDPLRLFRKGLLHSLNAIGHVENLPGHIVRDQEHA